MVKTKDSTSKRDKGILAKRRVRKSRNSISQKQGDKWVLVARHSARFLPY